MAKEANEADFEIEEVCSPEKPKKKALEVSPPEAVQFESGYIFDKDEKMDEM